MNKHDEYIERLDRIENTLDAILKHLMSRPSRQEPDIFPTLLGNQCSVCGIDLKYATGYVCYNNNCPNRTWIDSQSPKSH